MNAKDEAAAQGDISKLATGAGIALIGRIAGRGIHLVNQAAMARLLGPAAYGIFAIGWTILRIGSLFTALGLDNGVVRFGAKFHRDRSANFKYLILHGLGIALVAGTLAGGALYLSAPWLAEKVFTDQQLLPVFRSLSFTFPFVSGLIVAAAITRISQRLQFSVLAEDLAQPILMFAFLLLVFFLSLGLKGVILAVVVSFSAAFGLSLFLIWYLYRDAFAVPQSSGFPIGDLLVFSFPTALTGVFVTLIIWSDRLFIGYFGSVEDVGIYQAASQAPCYLPLLSAHSMLHSRR